MSDVMPVCCPMPQERMGALEAEYARVQEDYDNAARRFGEDPTKVPSGEFFSLVSVRLI